MSVLYRNYILNLISIDRHLYVIIKNIKNKVHKSQVINVFKNEFCFYLSFKLLKNMMRKLKQSIHTIWTKTYSCLRHMNKSQINSSRFETWNYLRLTCFQVIILWNYQFWWKYLIVRYTKKKIVQHSAVLLVQRDRSNKRMVNNHWKNCFDSVC